MNRILERLREEGLLESIPVLLCSVGIVIIGLLMGDSGIVAMWGFFSMCLLAVIIMFCITSGDSDAE